MAIAALLVAQNIYSAKSKGPFRTRDSNDGTACAIAQQRHDSQAARKLLASKEILLWMTPSEAPKALQASGCSELLDLTRTSSWISAQH